MAGLKIHIDTGEAERASQKLRKELAALGHEAVKDEKQFKALEDRMKDGLKADKAKQTMDSLQKSLGLTRIETAKFQAGIGDYSGAMKSLVSGNQKAVQSFGSLKAAASGMISIFAAYKISEIGQGLAMAGARYETLGVVMNNVGKIAGYNTKELEAYAEGVRKTGIQMDTSREVITKLIQAHIDLDNAQKLARIAQDAAVIGNTNSSEALERMVYGIQTAQIEVLKTIGINVNFEDSYKKIAAQLGKTASDLSESEKTQARLNVVMERGADIAGTYESAMDTAGKKITSLPRYINDFRIKMGLAFNPATADAVDAVTETMKMLNEEIVKPENQEALADIAQGFADWIVSNNDLIKQNLPEYIHSLGIALEGVSGIGRVVFETLSLVNTGIESLMINSKAAGMVSGGAMSISTFLTSSTNELKALVYNFDVSMNGINKRISDTTPGIDSYNKSVSSATGSTKRFRDSTDQASTSSKEYQKALSSLSDEYAKASGNAEEYGKYEIDKWYAEEAAALGKVTPKLQETYELMLKKNKAKHEEIALEKAYKSVKDAVSSAYENSWQSELDRFDTNNKKEQAEDIKNAWTKAEKEMQEATEKSQKEYEKAMEAQKEAYIDFSDTIKDNVKDIIKSHENMADKIVSIFEDMLYEIAATIIAQKIVVPIGLQVGSALGATWNGTPMSSMAGAGSNVLSMASGANSVYNAFNGGVSNFLGSGGMGGKIGSSIFGDSAWYGAGVSSGATAGALPFYGGAEYMVAAGTGSGGLAAGLAAAAPYAAIAAVAIPLLINAFKEEKDPVMAFHFGEDAAAGSTASDMGFYTYSQKMSGETNVMVKDYFEKQFKSIDNSLSINFADVIKKRAASADAGTDLMGTGWNPETYGGVENTLKVASTWIAKNLAQGVAEAYGLNGLTNGVGGTATSFFESILPNGSENLLDAFVRFGTVMDGTEDSANALARQMELLSGDTTQAFLNLENILTVFQSIDAMVDPLLQIKDPLVQIVDQFETWIDSLKEANATLDQISQAEDKRTQALGLQLTGLSSSNVGSSLLNTITAGGDIQSALTDIMGKSIADSLSVALTNEVMQDAITPFVEKVGQAFLDSGNDVEAVFAIMPALMAEIDLAASSEKIASFTDKWQAMFGSIESAEESLKNAEADRDAIGREYLSALRDEVSILENRMNDAKSVYVGLLEDELNAQESMVSGLESAIDSISKYRDSLYSGSASALSGYARQEALLIKRSVLAAQAMAGDVGSVNDLISTSQEYLAVAKDLSRTDLDYAREVAKTNALLKDVEDSAGKQLSEAEKQAQYFQGLIDSVNGTSEKITSIDEARTAYETAKMEFDTSWMQSEIANLEGLLESSKSLEQLMAEYLTAQNAVKTAGGGTRTATDYAQAEADYLAANPDVAAAVAAGDFASGKQHYEMYGQYESRGLEGYAGLTSEGRYLNLYPDVAKAVKEGQFSSGLQHYTMYGLGEGRGFATGGSFTVSGASGTDNLSLPQMRVTAGEIVNISRPDVMAELRVELKALRESMERTNYQLIKYTMTTAKVMKRSDDTDALLVRITA